VLRQPVVMWRHKQLNKEDVLLASYPRSGITWLQFLTLDLLTGEDPQFRDVRSKIPYIGEHPRVSPLLRSGGRLIHSHEPRSAAVAGPRVLYVVRDPRAVVVSEYRWMQRKQFRVGSIDDYLPRFLKGRSTPWGSWGHHLTRWLDGPAIKAGRLCFIRFEDLRANTFSVMKGVCRFLDLDATDTDVQRAIDDNAIERMRAKEDKGLSPGRYSRRDVRFVGTGEVSGWRTMLSPRQAQVVMEHFAEAMTRAGYQVP
jgi:hypothetical protein